MIKINFSVHFQFTGEHTHTHILQLPSLHPSFGRVVLNSGIRSLSPLSSILLLPLSHNISAPSFDECLCLGHTEQPEADLLCMVKCVYLLNPPAVRGGNLLVNFANPKLSISPEYLYREEAKGTLNPESPIFSNRVFHRHRKTISMCVFNENSTGWGKFAVCSFNSAHFPITTHTHTMRKLYFSSRVLIKCRHFQSTVGGRPLGKRLVLL